jgi:hypothetical protein
VVAGGPLIRAATQLALGGPPGSAKGRGYGWQLAGYD